MKTQEELRNGTTSNFVIFFGETELETRKSGSVNSKGGLVLTATLPTGEKIKGFSINGVKKALAESRRPELKGMFDFKY
jgi:hypothetical protein